MAKPARSISYLGNRSIKIRQSQVNIPIIYHMRVYRNRNGPDADYFIGTLHTYKDEFPSIVLFDPLAVEKEDIFNRKEVSLPDLERLDIIQPHNRIIIPKHFKAALRLEDEVIISGHGDQIRLWRPDVYAAYHRANPIDWSLWFKAEVGLI